MWTGFRAVQRNEDSVLDLLGQVVLERRSMAVGFVPRVAKHVCEKPLHYAVATDRSDRSDSAWVCKRHAYIRRVIDKPAVCEALDGCRNCCWSNAHAIGHCAGMGFAVCTSGIYEPVDGF